MFTVPVFCDGFNIIPGKHYQLAMHWSPSCHAVHPALIWSMSLQLMALIAPLEYRRKLFFTEGNHLPCTQGHFFGGDLWTLLTQFLGQVYLGPFGNGRLANFVVPSWSLGGSTIDTVLDYREQYCTCGRLSPAPATHHFTRLDCIDGAATQRVSGKCKLRVAHCLPKPMLDYFHVILFVPVQTFL